jgi:hypothetical protein
VYVIVQVQKNFKTLMFKLISLCRRRDDISGRCAGRVNEQWLFHGTNDPTVVKAIFHQGVDFRMHGKNGTAYGKGAYFAVEAAYSDNYTDKQATLRQMFLCRVLAGRSALGKTEYQRPPPIDAAKPHGELYDSCVNNVTAPTIYVVFDIEQCYPEYLIEYSEISQPDTVVRSATGFSSQTQNVGPYGNLNAASASRPTSSSSSAAPRSTTQAYRATHTNPFVPILSAASSSSTQSMHRSQSAFSSSSQASNSEKGCSVM